MLNNTFTAKQVSPSRFIEQKTRALRQSARRAIRRYPSLFNLEKEGLALLVISCVYLLSAFVYPSFGLKKIKLPQVAVEKITRENTIGDKERIKPYSFYQEAVSQRSIFASNAATEATSTLVAEVDSITDISLLGIIADNNPQAIIEDKKAQKTYYMSRGEYVGGFQVEDIKDGMIVLNNNGRRFTLQI